MVSKYCVHMEGQDGEKKTYPVRFALQRFENRLEEDLSIGWDFSQERQDVSPYGSNPLSLVAGRRAPRQREVQCRHHSVH